MPGNTKAKSFENDPSDLVEKIETKAEEVLTDDEIIREVENILDSTSNDGWEQFITHY